MNEPELENQSAESKFHQLLEANQLWLFREFLDEYLTNEFSKYISSLMENPYAIASIQRVKPILAHKSNVLAFANFKSGSKASFSLPMEAANRLGLNKTSLLLCFLRFLLRITIVSFARSLRALVLVFNSNNSHFSEKFEKYVYIFDISEQALNGKNTCSQSHNLENWIRKNLAPEAICIHHSVKSSVEDPSEATHCVDSFLPPIDRIQKLKIFVITFPRLLFCLFALLKGQWHHFFMLDDWIISQFFRLSSASRIYDFYIFPFQGNQYRPVWSYLAEEKGAKIVQLNYAANLVPALDGKYYDRDNLNISTWTDIIPFNEELAQVVSERVNVANINTVIHRLPPVHFTDHISPENIHIPESSIALFDIAPIDAKYHVGYSDYNDYLFNNQGTQGYYNFRFVSDVVDVAQSFEKKIVMKPKRPDPRVLCGYTKFIDELVERGSVILLPPQWSPSKVLDRCSAAVVFPFSTPGFFKPRDFDICFYDVAEKFGGKHQCSFGRAVISGKSSLYDWMSRLSAD